MKIVTRSRSCSTAGPGPCGRASNGCAHFKAFAAEKYVPFVAQVAFEREVVRRLERIEDKLDAQTKAFTGVIAGMLDE